MKQLLLTLSCFITIHASAQMGMIAQGANILRKSVNTRLHSLEALDYRIDTLHFYGQAIAMQRYNERELMGALGNNTRENNAVLSLVKLQEQLDKLNKCVIQHREMNFIDVAQTHINNIRAGKPRFDLSVYNNEYSFYRAYADTFGNGERERAKDEARIQKIVEEGNQAVLAYQQWKRDSLEMEQRRADAIQDSLNDILAQKEAKALEAKLKKKYGPKFGKAIMQQHVLLGMNREMAALAWGDDHYTTTKTTRGGTSETWTYGFKNYIIFTNGIVTTVSE